MRASADYRRKVAGALLVRYFIEATQPEVATRLVGAGAAFDTRIEPQAAE